MPWDEVTIFNVYMTERLGHLSQQTPKLFKWEPSYYHRYEKQGINFPFLGEYKTENFVCCWNATCTAVWFEKSMLTVIHFNQMFSGSKIHFTAKTAKLYKKKFRCLLAYNWQILANQVWRYNWNKCFNCYNWNNCFNCTVKPDWPESAG